MSDFGISGRVKHRQLSSAKPLRPILNSWVTSIVINSARMTLRRRPRQVLLALGDQPQDHDSEQVLEKLRDRQPSPEELS